MSSRQIVGLCCIAALVCACGKDDHQKTTAVLDRSLMPILDVGGVSTLISDSGVIRYRINAGRWQVYDKAEPTYWEFVEGVYLEKFNEALEVEASIQSDYAKYLDKDGFWELRGHVHAMNEKGEEFDTPQLFWNQYTEQIFSDSVITIHRETSTIVGIGFRSNQTMTEYTIIEPTGFFPVEDK